MDENKPSVEEIFEDFSGRRAAIIKALTIDYDEFYPQCSPEKENLCLFGFPNEHWEVKIPNKYAPPDLPGPVSGINRRRDILGKKDWVLSIATLSDSWLYSVAFYFCSKFHYNRTDRMRLFEMINELDMISDVILEAVKSKSDSDDDIRHVICAHCGGIPRGGRRWILCNKCRSWYHFECVDMTDSVFECMKGKYECPSCTQKRASEESAQAGKSNFDDSGKEDSDVCAECNSGGGERWICCELCKNWFHVECIDIPSSMVEDLEEYECPSCR